MVDIFGLDTLVLSRIQFAANISFHILFPAISMGLVWFLLYFKVRFHLSGQRVWMHIYSFWVKVFALTFALGVVSGITLSFQFGTNWPGFMEKVGNIAGPLLGYEVLTAFFMEATFLGVMLFGIRRVPGWVHTLSTFLVAIGTSLSGFWILALNSWMHTPAGFEMRDGVAFPVDWLAVIFNPSFGYRFCHMMIASGLTVCFFMAGLSAYRLIKGDVKEAPLATLKTAVIVASMLTPLQVVVGDLHGLNTLRHQPQKVAAIEALWHTEKGAPLVLFAWPNPDTRQNDFSIEIPGGASLLLTHDPDGEVRGLSDFEHVPPVKPVFFAFRLMVGMGMLMLLMALTGLWQIVIRKKRPKLLLRAYVAMTFSGWVATLSGWYVTEIGRQPWLVTGVLSVRDAVTTIAPVNVGISLMLYLTLYTALLIAYVSTLFILARKAVSTVEYDAEPLMVTGLQDAQIGGKTRD